MKVAGIVVLYNFNKKVVENIRTYTKYCEIVYAIDNSDKKNNLLEELNKIENLEYISLGENKGIAKALNVGIEKAKENGYKWALTMDQDSYFTENLLDKYEKIIKLENPDKIAIISPTYNYDRKKLETFSGYKQVEYIMQSANLINIKIWEEIGKFKEEFFIDVVDYEYCLRCNKKGYKIIQSGEAVLEHSPAITKSKKILGKELKYGYCSKTRIYYQARNLLWTAKKYKSIKMYLILMIKWLKILLLFDKKKEFFRAYNKGIKDCKNNRFGKEHENA